MGNISPRQSKSYHDGFTNNLPFTTATTTVTPNRSTWKKQLQIINDTLNIKKLSLRHTNGKTKRYRTTLDGNNQHSLSTQNFHDLMKNNMEKSDKKTGQKKLQENNEPYRNVKKSFSLFSIKQSLTDLTNKENITKPVNIIKEEEEQQQQQLFNSIVKPCNKDNQTINTFVYHKRRPKVEIVTVNKRHSTFVPPSYHLTKSQSQFYDHYQIQLSSHTTTSNNNNNNNNNHRHGLSSSTKHTRSTETTTTTTRKTIIQASTSELLRCLSEYLCSSCSHLLPILNPVDCIIWIKSADRQLMSQGWQEQVFVNPANIVFVYLIVRETLTYVVPSITIKSVTELHSVLLTCMYLSYSYMGNEITYPLKPFVTENETRDVFWHRVVSIMGQLSSKMLAINQNPKFFTECFSELKKFNLV